MADTFALRANACKGVSVQVRLRLPIFNMKSLWRIWAKALGEKASSDNCEADTVALIRTFIILFSILTNSFIIANVIRHW